MTACSASRRDEVVDRCRSATGPSPDPPALESLDSASSESERRSRKRRREFDLDQLAGESELRNTQQRARSAESRRDGRPS